MSPSKRVKIDPEAAEAILTIKADLARAQIRGLVNSLPESEADSILAVLDNPPEDEEEQAGGFVWDYLPAEVKNIIYRFLFVADTPIKPHIHWPNVPHRRLVAKCGLGANFLRCSKTIYAEGKSILRMENTFEVALVRKIFLRAEKLSWTIMTTLRGLDNIAELTLGDRPSWTTCTTQTAAEGSAARAFSYVVARFSQYTYDTAFLNRFPKVYYVAERRLQIPIWDKKSNDRIAFRFSVERKPRPEVDGPVEDEDDLWSVGNFDLKVLARKEYRSKGYREYSQV